MHELPFRRCWLAAGFLLANAVFAADFDTGVQAYARGDHAAAVRAWLPLAEQGDAAAQYSLAMLYSQGLGVQADLAEAVRWYRAAGEGGVTAAQFTLGLVYSQGLGVEPDMVEAARWYRRAALAGDADGQFALGLMTMQGRGVEADVQAAVAWYRRAARQGLVVARATLGLLHENGHGVAQDDVCAYAWLNLAAAKGSEGIVARRDALRARLSTAQIERGQALAPQLRRLGTCVESEVPPPLASALVKQVQLELRARGYDPGEPQGVLDAGTTAAIQAFQRDLGLTPTGSVSEELLALIRKHGE